MLPTHKQSSPRMPSRHESLPSAASSIAHSANNPNDASCRYNSDAQLTVGASHTPSNPHEPASSQAPLRRWYTNWLAARRNSDGPSEGIRGELGLRLVYASPEPLANLIFVHGLRGGSVKTWRKGADPRYFWPQCWLPLEEGFNNVNIHSFGYDSDWGTTKQSVLNVHDFGRALYEEMRTSRCLRNHAETPIILVGHSMGGLVIKKAFILAHQNATATTLSDRIRCIFFLATPHRGSDFAAILRNVLSVSQIPKEYVTDLMSGSTSTQTINEDFPQYTGQVSLFSFYETLPMSLGGISTGLVVDKNSAVLGYRGESSTFVNANHRNICKFDGIDDPNYIKLRDALGSAVADLLRDVRLTKNREAVEQLQTLKSYVTAETRSDENYDKVEGSCTWIHDREDFNSWRDVLNNVDGTDPAPTIYWIHAGPGTGKTVLASHVVSHLQDYKLECAYYHFHFGKKNAETLGGFLRSIALHMARSNGAVRGRLFESYRAGVTFDQDDARAIWATLFKGAIFQIRLLTPQYWVIDAIDECINFSELLTLLKRDQPCFPLRIFMTSRKDPEIRRLLRPFQENLTAVEIPVYNTMKDIETYIAGHMDELPIGTTIDTSALSQKILIKSGANFLWVRLVMDELRRVCADETISDVLETIPKGMVSYYETIIAKMAENKREKHISKAILLWVATATRPLSTRELAEALELDVNSRFSSMLEAIERLCGQLVVVDEQTALVRIIHATAVEFLQSEAAGEFRTVPSEAHERIALNCLRVLSDRKLARPPTHRHLAKRRLEVSGFLDYAITQFSEHVYSASSESDKLLSELDRFLGSNVLTLIELLSRQGTLQGLVQVAKNLGAYLDRRSKHASHLDCGAQAGLVREWSVTLSRLVTKFGKALLSSPTCIYFLIPTFCPTTTAIYKTFGKVHGGLSVIGFKNEVWNDCVAALGLGGEAATAVACSETSIAIGMESGGVQLFHHRTFQQKLVLPDNHPVNILHFTNSGKNVVSSTNKFLILWDMEGQLVWSTRIRSRCLLLTSTSTELIGITEHGLAISWDILSGKVLEEFRFPYKSPTESPSALPRAPSLAALSPSREVLALAYSLGPICLWDFKDREFVDFVGDEEGVVDHLVLSPNPDVAMLLVAYSGSTLALYDSWSGVQIHLRNPETDTDYESIACSRDGNTLATLDVLGNLRIWDFEALIPLYEVRTPPSPFRILRFTLDGANVVDVSGFDVRVWSPASLVRKRTDEDESTSDSEHTMVTGQFVSFAGPKITSICAHPVKPVAFATNSSGQVMSYDVGTGKLQNVLYEHPGGVYVTEVVVGSKDVIASRDILSVVQVWQLEAATPAGFRAKTLLFQISLPSTIRQILFDTPQAFLLVSTTESAYVYNLQSSSCVGTLDLRSSTAWSMKWFPMTNPLGKEEFCVVLGNKLMRYSISEFPNPAVQQVLQLGRCTNSTSEETIKQAVYDAESSIAILETRHLFDLEPHAALSLFHVRASSDSDAGDDADGRVILPFASRLLSQSAHFIGIGKADDGRRILFLDRESWIASMKILDALSSSEQETVAYTRHFFVPDELAARSSEVPPVKTAGNDIVFCLHGGLAIVKNGLKFKEVKHLKD